MKKIIMFETEDGKRYDDFDEAVRAEKTKKASKKFREYFPFGYPDNNEIRKNPFCKSASYFINKRHELLECMKEIIKIMDD